QRLVNEPFSASEIHVVLSKRVPESVHQHRIIRSLLQQLFQHFDRLFDPTGSLQDNGTVVLNSRMFRMPFESIGDYSYSSFSIAMTGKQSRLGQARLKLRVGMIGDVVVHQQHGFGTLAARQENRRSL